MGMGPFHSCSSGYMPTGPAPNPNPSRWELLRCDQFGNGYVLVVRYLDCTNYEGVKVMVFRGRWIGGHRPLDPHFQEGDAGPVARFNPGEEGLRWAIALAKSL